VVIKTDKSLKKDEKTVDDATAEVEGLIQALQYSRERSIGLTQDFNDKINFYTAQKKRLKTVVDFVDKVLPR